MRNYILLSIFCLLAGCSYNGVLLPYPDRPHALEEAEAVPELRWGYINDCGNYEITPRFSKAVPFIGDRAIVQVGDLCGVIDREGKYVILPQRHWLSHVNGIMRVVRMENEGRSPEYLDMNGQFHSAYSVPVINAGFWATSYIDDIGHTGRESTVYTAGGDICDSLDIDGVYSGALLYGNSLTWVAIKNATGEVKWYALGSEGLIKDASGYDVVWYSGKSFSLVGLNGESGLRLGLVDSAGKRVLKPEYLFLFPPVFTHDYPSLLGYATEDEKDGYMHGIIDIQGNTVVRPTYESLFVCSPTRAAAKKHGGDWTLLDIQTQQELAVSFDEICIDFQYPLPSDGKDFYLLVSRKGKHQYIDLRRDTFISFPASAATSSSISSRGQDERISLDDSYRSLGEMLSKVELACGQRVELGPSLSSLLDDAGEYSLQLENVSVYDALAIIMGQVFPLGPACVEFDYDCGRWLIKPSAYLKGQLDKAKSPNRLLNNIKRITSNFGT